jgi:carbon-monoxide dehydrogenase medium subunit
MKELLELINKVGAKGKILAGGTDLISGVRAGKITLPANIIDINRVMQLNSIDHSGDVVEIGAAAKLADILASNIVTTRIRILGEAISEMGSAQVRNMGTIGGNLCNASPAADTAPPLLVLDSKLHIMGVGGDKVVSVHEFFLGPGKTLLSPTEVLTRIEVPMQPPDAKCTFVKLGRRRSLTLSTVCVAAIVRTKNRTFEDVRIALGAVAPTPLRIRKAEESLKGKRVCEDSINEASMIVRDEVKPITDVRASKEYRREMSYELTKRTLTRSSGLSGNLT